MKRLKMVMCLLLCLTIIFPLFAACKKDDLGNVVYGRYVEEDISPEGMKGNPMSLVSSGDGGLDLITADWSMETMLPTYYRWRSADGGKTWESVDMSWTEDYIFDYSEYYEKGQTPPEEVSLGGLTLFENGDIFFQLYRYTYDAETEMSDYNTELYRVTDGKVALYEVPELKELEEKEDTYWLGQVQALPGNRLFINYSIDAPPEAWEDPNFDYSQLERTSVFDFETGKKLYDVSGETWQMLYNENALFFEQEDGITAVNIADGTPAEIELPTSEMMQKLSQGGYMGQRFVDGANNFYSISAHGMQKVAPGQEETEVVMEGLNYTYGSPLYYIGSTVYNAQDESLIIGVANAFESKAASGRILRYVWDDEAIASSDKKLHVYSLYENYAVRLGLSEFKRRNPDVTIEYETVFKEDETTNRMNQMSGGGVVSMTETPEPDDPEQLDKAQQELAKTEEDALRALNTELLNGTGPDVIILDGLPMESFIDKGVLEDLSSIVDGNDDIMRPIVDPLYRDNKIYTVPANFYAPVLFGDKGYIEQFTSLDSLTKAIQDGAGIATEMEVDPEWTEEQQEEYYNQMYGPKAPEDQPVFYIDTLRDLYDIFYGAAAPSIMSEKEGVNEENLGTFLKNIKQIAEKYGLNDPERMAGADAGKGGMVMFGGYGNYENSVTLDRYASQQSRLGYSRLGSYNTLTNLSFQLHWSQTENGPVMDAGETPAEEGTDQPAEAPEPQAPANQHTPEPKTVVLPGLSEGAYFPVQMMGVTTTSKQGELARGFVEAMLSNEVQNYDIGSGFPVTKSGMENQEKEYNFLNEFMVREKIELVQLDYTSIVEQLKTPCNTNTYLDYIVYKTVEKYCTGELDEQAAVQQIVKETELYFAERK